MNLIEIILVLTIIAGSASLTLPALNRMNKSADEQVKITKVVHAISKTRLMANIQNKKIDLYGMTFYPNLTNTKGSIEFERRKVVVSNYGVVRVVRF